VVIGRTLCVGCTTRTVTIPRLHLRHVLSKIPFGYCLLLVGVPSPVEPPRLRSGSVAPRAGRATSRLVFSILLVISLRVNPSHGYRAAGSSPSSPRKPRVFPGSAFHGAMENSGGSRPKSGSRKFHWAIYATLIRKARATGGRSVIQ